MSEAVAVTAVPKAAESITEEHGVWTLNGEGQVAVRVTRVGNLYEVTLLLDGDNVKMGYSPARFDPAMCMLRGMELALSHGLMSLGKPFDPRLLRLTGAAYIMQLALAPTRGAHVSTGTQIVGLVRHPSGWYATAFGTASAHPHATAIGALRPVIDTFITLGLLR